MVIKLNIENKTDFENNINDLKYRLTTNVKWHNIHNVLNSLNRIVACCNNMDLIKVFEIDKDLKYIEKNFGIKIIIEEGINDN